MRGGRLLLVGQVDTEEVGSAGHVVTTGGPELADRLEGIGYEGLAAELGVEDLAVRAPEPDDPFADPGF